MKSTASDASKGQGKKPGQGEKPDRDAWITVIAIGKLLKATALIVAGIVAIRMVDGHSALELHRTLARAGIAPSNHLVNEALEKIAGLDRKHLAAIGIGSFVYAGLFLVEGLGLFFKKRWAEYFTIAITGSFIPFEIYEIVKHVSAGRIVTVVLNLAAVAYLVWHLRHSKRAAPARESKGVPATA